jgi:hypothetical protein
MVRIRLPVIVIEEKKSAQTILRKLISFDACYWPCRNRGLKWRAYISGVLKDAQFPPVLSDLWNKAVELRLYGWSWLVTAGTLVIHLQFDLDYSWYGTVRVISSCSSPVNVPDPAGRRDGDRCTVIGIVG